LSEKKYIFLGAINIVITTLPLLQSSPLHPSAAHHCSWTIDSTITTILQQPALTTAVTPIQFPTPPLFSFQYVKVFLKIGADFSIRA